MSITAVSIWTLLLASAGAANDTAAPGRPDPGLWAKQNMDDLGALYQRLHANPELSFHEKETAAQLAELWASLGAEVTTGVGGHGVVGIFSNRDGPMVMLRCDMDALPVREQTRLVYASKVTVRDQEGAEVGVMHACGHDIHMTSAVGVARYLSSHRDLWKGKLMLVAQPAEERGAGAKAMLDDGLFTRFGKPTWALALHVDAGRPVGQIGVRAGYALANVDSVDITVYGKGGHGAYPHLTIDPVVQAAQLVMSLQTIVSREVKPTESAVVTVGSIHGGTKHNVIADECRLQLTVRSYSDDVRAQVLAAIQRKAEAVAAGAGAPMPAVSVSEGTPALWNDQPLTDRLSPVLRRALGDDNVVPAEPSMGGEDFSRYGKAGVPIFMFWLGSVDAQRLRRYEQLGQKPPSLHSAEYYPDYEETIITGVKVTATAILELLAP